MPSDILIHPAIWPQQIWAEGWGLCAFGGGELGPHVTQCGQGRGLPTTVHQRHRETGQDSTDRQTTV